MSRWTMPCRWAKSSPSAGLADRCAAPRRGSAAARSPAGRRGRCRRRTRRRGRASRPPRRRRRASPRWGGAAGRPPAPRAAGARCAPRSRRTAVDQAHRLDRQLALDLRVLGEVDLAHRPGARAADDAVAAERASPCRTRSSTVAPTRVAQGASARTVPLALAARPRPPPRRGRRRSASASTRRASSRRAAGTRMRTSHHADELTGSAGGRGATPAGRGCRGSPGSPPSARPLLAVRHLDDFPLLGHGGLPLVVSDSALMIPLNG